MVLPGASVQASVARTGCRVRDRAAELVDLARAGEDHVLVQELAGRAVEQQAQVGIAPALVGAGQGVVGTEPVR